MPYRVKITNPELREPFFWPGVGEEPAEMSEKEAAQVVADYTRLCASLARYAQERGEQWMDRQSEAVWVKGGRRVLRGRTRTPDR